MDFKKAIYDLQPYFAVAITVLLIVTSTLLYQNQQIEKEIRENCGWGEEDFRCVCEKSDVIKMENEILEMQGGIDNVRLVG